MAGIFCFLIAIFYLAEIFFFSLPARIPTIKRYAIRSRSRRWNIIILLSIAIAVTNYIGLNLMTAHTEVLVATLFSHMCSVTDDDCNPEERAFTNTFHLNYELKDELINEIAVRRFMFYSGENCLLNNTEVCIALNDYYARQAESQSESSFYDLLKELYLYGVFLSPSFFTGYIVYRITRDGRKQKRSILS